MLSYASHARLINSKRNFETFEDQSLNVPGIQKRTFDFHGRKLDLWTVEEEGGRTWYRAEEVVLFIGYRRVVDPVQRTVHELNTRLWCQFAQSVTQDAPFEANDVFIDDLGMYNLLRYTKKHDFGFHRQALLQQLGLEPASSDDQPSYRLLGHMKDELDRRTVELDRAFEDNRIAKEKCQKTAEHVERLENQLARTNILNEEKAIERERDFLKMEEDMTRQNDIMAALEEEITGRDRAISFRDEEMMRRDNIYAQRLATREEHIDFLEDLLRHREECIAQQSKELCLRADHGEHMEAEVARLKALLAANMAQN